MGVEKWPLEAKVEVLSREVEGGVVAKGLGGSLSKILEMSRRLEEEEGL